MPSDILDSLPVSGSLAGTPGIRPKRVLLISYGFPPVGGAGVQRVTKFVKYLPETGWLPSVLTVANPSVPVQDSSLGEDIPPETAIRRARTWEPSYTLKSTLAAGGGQATQREPGWLRDRLKTLTRRTATFLLQPDAQILWKPDAVREGKRLLRELPHDVIVATGPPFSTFLVGATLSRWSGLPLVLDYRDEWSISNAYWENRRPDFFSRQLQHWMQRRVVRRARALLATTHRSAQTLQRLRDQTGSSATVSWIYNGFDPDDFPNDTEEPEQPPQADGTYRLVYVGTLWTLTSVEPLVQAVRDLAHRRPDLVGRLELVFAGRRIAEQQRRLDALKALPCRVVEHPYLNHVEALRLLRSAQGLCVLLSGVEGAERVVPAKVFEYLAARRPILAIAPRGELWEIVRAYPAGSAFEPHDLSGISRYLEQALSQTDSQPSSALDWNTWDVSRYDRRSQTWQLAELLDSLVGHQSRSGTLEDSENLRSGAP